MAIIYTDKDNAAIFQLQKDKSVIDIDVVTRAVMWLPASADASEIPAEILFDTDLDTDIELTDNATSVTVRGSGGRTLKTGRYTAYLTIYDVVNTNGIAWDTIPLQIGQWND